MSDGQQWWLREQRRALPDDSAAQVPTTLGAHQELGLDGKPFDVWDGHSAAATNPQVAAPGAAPAVYGVNPEYADAPPAGAGFAVTPPPPAPAPMPYRAEQTMPTAYYGGAARGSVEQSVLAAPRRSIEANGHGWTALGLGLAATIVGALNVTFGLGALPSGAGLISAGAGLYWGIRSHNAGVNGFATNGRTGLVGAVLSVVGGLATVFAVVFASALATAR